MTEPHPSVSTELADEHTRLCESLSLLMDNHQLSELELQRLLKHSAELTSVWNRYHIASASLRRDLPIVAPADFAARVSAAIAAEDNLSVGANNLVSKKTWWWSAGRVAVAASVAGLLVVGVQQYSSLTATDSLLVAADNNAVLPPLDNKAAHLPSGINVPSLPARTVAVQGGYQSQEPRLQSNNLQDKPRMTLIPIQQMTSAEIEDINRYLHQLIQERNNPASNTPASQNTGTSAYKRVILVGDKNP